MDYKQKVITLLDSQELSEEQKRKLKEIFPELHESEDERIRKELIEIVNNLGTGVIPTPKNREEILAYLEKQKEQTPVEPSYSELQRHQDELHDFKVFAAKQAREHHISFVHDFEWDNFCAELLSYFNEKEQQPSIKEPKYESFEDGNATGWRIKQQPAEWSKEDEKMLKDCSVAITSSDYYFSYEERCAMDDWLKSLRPQPHWKPNEKEIIAFENLLKGEFPDKIFPGATLSGLLGKLKMLYYNAAIPYWKPSEEQMEALKEAVYQLDGSEYSKGIDSLFNDLEKL